MKTQHFLLPALIASLCVTHLSAQTTVFNENFNAGSFPANFSVSGGSLATIGPRTGCTSATYCTKSIGLATGNGSMVNNTLSLNVPTLATHTLATVSFSLFLFDTWDGNGANGPDYFLFDANGSPLVRTTFRNFSGFGQCYPVLICKADVNNPGFTGAAEVASLGAPATAVYLFSFIFNHSASSAIFDWSGQNLLSQADEGWSIDNVVVTTNATTVPEPGTYVLLASGLIILGGVRGIRSRRSARATLGSV